MPKRKAKKPPPKDAPRPVNLEPPQELVHTVEERLRVIFVYLETMKGVASMVTEIDAPAPGFNTRQEFAAWVKRMANVTGLQLAAIEAVLPPSCTDREAPI